MIRWFAYWHWRFMTGGLLLETIKRHRKDKAYELAYRYARRNMNKFKKKRGVQGCVECDSGGHKCL